MRRDLPDVVVIGGGAIGAACALELARCGARTTLLERGPAAGSGCSYGSAGLISAAHATPLANPAALRQGLRWMLDRSSPFSVRLSPRIVPWLIRFALASTAARSRRAAPILRELATRGREMHEEYAESGIDTGFHRRGSISLYETETGFRAGQREAALHGTAGQPARVLDRTELRELGVDAGDGVAGGIFFPGDAHCDSHKFVTCVAAAAAAAGAALRTGVAVHRLKRTGDRIELIETSDGSLRPAQVVLAAGVWSSRLARDVGINIPLQAGKGYHLELAPGVSDPHLPIYMQESRVIATPLAGRLRVAGTLELSGTDARIDPIRLAAVRRAAERNLKGLAGREVKATWSGLRPCTPDGLPVIGRSRSVENLIVATGHVMKGIALAPITGRLVAEIVSGEQPSVDLASVTPERFSSFRQAIFGSASS